MYRLSLFNVGEGMVTRDISLNVVSLRDAKLLAIEKCEEISGYSPLVLSNAIDCDYDVLRDARVIGGIVLTRL